MHFSCWIRVWHWKFKIHSIFVSPELSSGRDSVQEETQFRKRLSNPNVCAARAVRCLWFFVWSISRELYALLENLCWSSALDIRLEKIKAPNLEEACHFQSREILFQNLAAFLSLFVHISGFSRVILVSVERDIYSKFWLNLYIINLHEFIFKVNLWTSNLAWGLAYWNEYTIDANIGKLKSVRIFVKRSERSYPPYIRGSRGPP